MYKAQYGIYRAELIPTRQSMRINHMPSLLQAETVQLHRSTAPLFATLKFKC